MTFCLIQSELLLQHNLFKEALEVAGAGTELFQDSVMMWQVKLQVLIASESPDVAMVFDEAFVRLKPQVCELGLWFFILLGKLLRPQPKLIWSRLV